jgi:hypothetical protein
MHTIIIVIEIQWRDTLIKGILNSNKKYVDVGIDNNKINNFSLETKYINPNLSY